MVILGASQMSNFLCFQCSSMKHEVIAGSVHYTSPYFSNLLDWTFLGQTS